jgi:predicted PhzF superfamily epimerase YddE/YHI9
MDFPLRQPTLSTPLPELDRILNMSCKETWQFDDKVIVEVDSADAIRKLQPDFSALARYDLGALILTARDTDYDFVSRYLKPRATLKEDPVTGSAHCILVPYWQKRLHKNQFHAYQASPRGGELTCTIKGERVLLSGNAVFRR